eukprot:690423-Pyramimonas_sp.AAC.1
MRVAPPPRPTVARPARKNDDALARARTGNPGQYCCVCSGPLVDVCARCSMPACRGHLGMIAEWCARRAWYREFGRQGDLEKGGGAVRHAWRSPCQWRP